MLYPATGLTRVSWRTYVPVAATVALRCTSCRWRASRLWWRDAVAPLPDDALRREARAWLGDPTAEHHRADVWLLARLVALGVAEALELRRPPRPYAPSYACHWRVSALAVGVSADIGDPPLAVACVRPGDDVVAVVGRAMAAAGCEWAEAGSDVTLRTEAAKRLGWRRVL